ncbi:Mitochondrial metalloendopeptidase OMA1 [Hordeum vulgare]|uniref:mitochondrial metalloendopeptidase OMA1-like n=1 Tax=Hordeum vulgare subsp. vulgare TaxID=112509 RepID=UPI001D1A533E|nr:mitochondrial metalloendopeptidase OMA1-like [Hordeum vulgare subsp. vulgare]KAE8804105.1 Mitochondrial metalloendopeptidase OMA1 [Hordeum vulgare]
MSALLRNLRPALLRSKPAVRTPVPPPPTASRCYHSPLTRRSHEAPQPPGLGRFFRRDSDSLVRRQPQPSLPRPRCYSSRRPRSPSSVKFQIGLAGVVIVGGGVATICYGTFETVPYTNRRHFVVLTHNGELTLGESQFDDEKKKLGDKVLPQSHPDYVRVNAVATKIIRAACRTLATGQGDDKHLETWVGNAPPCPAPQPMTKHLDGFKWEVILVDNKQVNAMCMPGGKIIVYTGLLQKFNTDAEIATVLGHEVAHAVARHAAEGLTKNMWILMLAVFLQIFIDAPKLIDNLTEYLLRLPFSRKMEIEADHIGILLLAAAGFDPRIAPAVYEKLGKVGGNSSSLKEYISTHPCSKKRTQLLLDAKVMDKAMALYTEARARKRRN